MNLFGKKKKEETAGCCCGGNCTPETMAQAENAKNEGASVKILGSGCAKCNQLEEATRAALEQLGMDTAVDHVTDFSQIAAYGVMTTPALVVDGKVVSMGKVLKTEEVKKNTSEDEGVEDPTGKDDDEFVYVIQCISENIEKLKKKIYLRTTIQ